MVCSCLPKYSGMFVLLCLTCVASVNIKRQLALLFDLCDVRDK